MNIIDLKNATKRYGRKTVIDSIYLQFESGNIYGLLGSNGAGKTTLINMITNRVFATAGEVLIDGQPVWENETVQEKVFCITEKGDYPRDLKVSQLFSWEKKFHPKFDITYAYELAKKFDLDTKSRLKSLSTGYKTIVKVVLTLASNAEIMILDEPVLGIDSLYREIFYNELQEHHKKNKNLIIIATHLIPEVEKVIEKVIIIVDGKLITDCDIGVLTGEAEGLNDAYIRILREYKHGQK